jgi:hypothetical protein
MNQADYIPLCRSCHRKYDTSSTLFDTSPSIGIM